MNARPTIAEVLAADGAAAMIADVKARPAFDAPDDLTDRG